MSCKKENILKNYSLSLLENNPEIKKIRKIDYIKDMFNDKNDYDELKDFSKKLNLKFKNNINLIQNDVVYSIKTNIKDDYMKWHCDDALIISHKSNLIQNVEINQQNQFKISDKKCLYYPNKIPKYSLIIYGSTYNQDFEGGILEFSDGTKIKPEKNLCVFFDSREAHCVHKIKSGKKECILIKFF